MTEMLTNMRRVLAEGAVPDAGEAGIGEIVVFYASRSDAGTWHRCSYSPRHGFRCTCKGYTFNVKCWHITDLRLRLAGWTPPGEIDPAEVSVPDAPSALAPVEAEAPA